MQETKSPPAVSAADQTAPQYAASPPSPVPAGSGRSVSGPLPAPDPAHTGNFQAPPAGDGFAPTAAMQQSQQPPAPGPAPSPDASPAGYMPAPANLSSAPPDPRFGQQHAAPAPLQANPAPPHPGFGQQHVAPAPPSYPVPAQSFHGQAPHPSGIGAAPHVVFPPPTPHPMAHGPSPMHPTARAPQPMGEIPAEPAAAEYVSGGKDIVIPRISVEAFFERPAVQSSIAAAAGDRRMSDASVEIIAGGLPAAIARYGSQPNPNVIIVESSLPGPQVIAQLDALANLCDEDVKVMVVGVTNDVVLYRELMRRGVSEYLIPPLQPLNLIRAIAGLVGDPDSPFSGRTVTVRGVKGGVGASSVAHNLAWAFAERIQQQTTLVDLDFNFGTAALNFNRDKLQSIADAFASPDRFDSAVIGRMAIRISEHLSLLNAPSTLDSGFEFEAEVHRTIINEIRKTVPFVILDTPNSWAAGARVPLVSADDVVLVATPDLASLRNAKSMVDHLVSKRPNDSPPRLILNMIGISGRPEVSEKEFVSALGMEPAAMLAFEPRLFGEAANSGQMLAAISPDARCVRIIDRLASALTGREPVRSRGGVGAFFGRLFAPAK